MTPDEYSDALTAVGWTPTILADQLSMNDRQARRWRTGENAVPYRVAEWLAKIAAYHAANPPPPFNVKPLRGGDEVTTATAGRTEAEGNPHGGEADPHGGKMQYRCNPHGGKD